MCCSTLRTTLTANIRTLLLIVVCAGPACGQSSALFNGLQTKGTVSISVEAIFSDIGYTNALVGDSRAPQVFGSEFHAVSLDAVEGGTVGGVDLDPTLIGQSAVQPESDGTKIRINYRAPDSSGIELDGFWLGDAVGSWQRGVGGLTAGADPTTPRVTAALPLFDGAAGYAVPYDQFFRFDFGTRVSGLGAHYAPESYFVGATLVQPTFGLRYIDLEQTLAFSGADSGLTLTFLSTGIPDPAVTPTVVVPPYQSILNAESRTDLIGPVLGLNYSTSGRYLRVSGTTRAGFMVVDSQQTLTGRGFGNGFAAGFNPTLTFTDSRSDTYASAIFEQTFNVDIEVLRLLPAFRRHFRTAESSLVLRLGWTFMAISDVIQMADAVNWNGFPLTPTLNTSQKSNWYLQTFNCGVVFQY